MVAHALDATKVRSRDTDTREVCAGGSFARARVCSEPGAANGWLDTLPDDATRRARCSPAMPLRGVVVGLTVGRRPPPDACRLVVGTRGRAHYALTASQQVARRRSVLAQRRPAAQTSCPPWPSSREPPGAPNCRTRCMRRRCARPGRRRWPQRARIAAQCRPPTRGAPVGSEGRAVQGES
jgi:hypothetical protein